jgi:hypothetical protein
MFIMLKRIVFTVISQLTPIFEGSSATPYFLLIAMLFIFLWFEQGLKLYVRHTLSMKSLLWASLAMTLLLCDGFVFNNPSISGNRKDVFLD